MELNEYEAREILDSAHAAWSCGDIDGSLSFYVEDLTYVCNTGGADGGPLQINGRQALREMLLEINKVAEGISVTDYFRFRDGVARATVECFIRHRMTSHTLVGSYRQLVTYRDNKIARLEEFHDAARMITFWRMVSSVSPIESSLLVE